MSPGTLVGAVGSVTLAASVSLLAILQACDLDKVCSPGLHYFPAYITTKDAYQDLVQHAILDFCE